MTTYILAETAILGVPQTVLARMLDNLVLDATVGSISLVGGTFDAA